MKSIGKRLAGSGPFWIIAILFAPTYIPTPEESERYWDAKMNSEMGIDACTLYGPDDYWWWQQLEELQKQSAERKRFDKRINRIVIAWAAVTAAGICFAVAVTKMYAK